jgi:heat-inducible transcriptional repressor
VPTDLGYRTFVDKLMQAPGLPARDRTLIKREVEQLKGATDELTRECSRLLGRLSNLLGVVLTPRLSTGVLERLEVVPLSSSRVMFVISLRGGLFKTIVLELEAALNRSLLDDAVDVLNERLAGLTLDEIRRTYDVRIQDLQDEQTGLVRLVLEESASLFSEPSDNRLSYAGAQYMLALPEFQEPDGLKHLIEMLEDENFIVQLLEDRPGAANESGRALVRIGRENRLSVPPGGRPGQIERFSVVAAPYRVGDTTGTVGVIGPTRMDYTRVISLVEGLAAVLSLSATPAQG